MSFFRSERMAYYQLVLHQETAFDCFVELGYLGKAQFVNDYNSDYVPNLKYVSEVQRCTALQLIIERLQDEVNKSGMYSYYYPNVDADEIPRSEDLPQIETVLQNLDMELTEVLKHCSTLQEQQFSLIERREVLKKAEDFLTGAHNTESQIASYDSLMSNMLHDSSKSEAGRAVERIKPLNFIAGSIPRDRFPAFERMVWRVTRGNAYVKFTEFELPEDIAKSQGQSLKKHAFLVMFMGNELRGKLTKICQGFQARIYECPESNRERRRELYLISSDLDDLQAIFDKSLEHKRRILNAAIPDLYIWRSKIRKINAVYYMLNRLGTVRELRDQNQKYLQAECWIPKSDVAAARAALQYGARRAAHGDANMIFPPMLNEYFNPRSKPPTYFVTNKFTQGFQALVDSYGIASYQELNPAPYTIVTFPFLFAVMFGDIGHGIILAIFALMMILPEHKIERKLKESINTSEIFTLFFGGRYIILLMGVFSIYTGFIYNDIFSKPMNLFGSSWRVVHKINMTSELHLFSLDPARKDHYRGTPYVFGVDPIWAVSENVIIIMNSLKMKIAIILGVIQMIFGITLSAWNALHFENKVDFFLVFIPQIVFFTCLFFYLALLVFHKWTWFGGQRPSEYGSSCAPSILITFINMVLLKNPDPAPEDCVEHMYHGQPIAEKVLLFIALAAIPILLLGKPLHFMFEHSKIKTIKDKDKQTAMRRSTLTKLRKSLIYNVDNVDSNEFIATHEQSETLTEIWIHQGIHTIESVLGSVSHTASYLRLWALSLAHSQLSHVLWQRVLGTGLKMNFGFNGSLVIFFCFGFFAVLTIAILVTMEGLSAFLHTLRLHWVEFQSKFYGGAGEAFLPFRFEPSRKSDAATIKN